MNAHCGLTPTVVQLPTWSNSQRESYSSLESPVGSVPIWKPTRGNALWEWFVVRISDVECCCGNVVRMIGFSNSIGWTCLAYMGGLRESRLSGVFVGV